MLFRKKKKAPHKQRAVNAFKRTFGTETHKAGWSIIRMPVDVLRRRKETGEDPDKLKQLSFDELLQHWQIPREKIPRLKRTLAVEMVAYGLLAALGLFSVAYKFFNPDYSLIAVLLGLLIGTASLMHLLLRHHWYSIIKNEQYRTFREYIWGEEENR